MTCTVQTNLKRFSIATLGCKVNQFETADMIEQLQADGWQLVPFGDPADLCLINSCTVTARSDAESRRLIRRARRTNPKARIVATGCYAQVAPKELTALPEVDLVIGNEEKRDICALIKGSIHKVSDLTTLKNTGHLRLTSFAEHTRAFLQIQNGCEACCSYCIVPIARGPSRSVPLTEVAQAVTRLVGSDYKEVVLTGIHLGEYGADLSPLSSLTELVQLLDDQALIPRLRLGSIEPNELTEQLLALFCSSSRICHHLHIPLQSGSDSVLKRMGRHYDSSLYRTRIEQAHRLLPDAFIAADLIAGFPGETEQEFLETCQLIESLPLADLHVFPYSRRPGTAAATMQGHLQPGVIKERAEQLRTTAAAKRRAFQQQCINNPLQVLGQHYNQQTGLMNGLSRNYLEVCYPATPLLLNQEVVVQVDELKDGRLLGRCTPPRSY